jgi:hypothetical protein
MIDYPSTEEVALYDVQKILECIRVKAWSSIPLYAQHLSMLAAVKTIQQERELYPPIKIVIDHKTAFGFDGENWRPVE